MKDVHLKDLTEFLGWAMKQNAKTRFKLDDRYGTVDGKRQYQLDVAGSGDKFRPMQSIHIPREVGEPLAEVWKTNNYGSYVGLRNIKSILKILKVSDVIIAKYEVTRLAIKAQQERQRKHNNGEYVLERIEFIKRELDQINESLDRLDMHSANLIIPGLEDTRLRLVGLVEMTK